MTAVTRARIRIGLDVLIVLGIALLLDALALGAGWLLVRALT